MSKLLVKVVVVEAVGGGKVEVNVGAFGAVFDGGVFNFLWGCWEVFLWH